MTPRPRAKRMAPEARREKILDAAVELILAAGHAGCSLEEVAQAAHISTPLIYKYFPKREELLKALLEREFEELRGRGLDSVPRAEPALTARARAGNRASRVSTTDYFIRKFMDSYGVPKDVARIAVTMVVSAPVLSIPSLKRRDISAERT